MKVKIIRTGKEVSVSDTYGARLIEQGKAVFCAAKAEKAAEKSGKRKKADGTEG